MSETNAAPRSIAREIMKLPPEGVPEVLTACIKACIQKKVYGDRRISEICESIERRLRGELLPPENPPEGM